MSARGRAMARLLARSWRGDPAAPESLPLAAELGDCSSLLLDGGAGALAWMRLRGTPLERLAVAAKLRDAHRVQTLAAAVQRRQVANALARLRSVGVTALCAKGWTLARHYGHPGLRAGGDIDVYVAPADYARADAALAAVAGELDLHAGLRPIADRDFATVAARAERVAVGEEVARVLSPADQLRLVCVHMLGHGAWRPLWLCDVAALVEAGGIDWAQCLAGATRHARWVACAVVAARDLLDADLSSVPATVRDTRPPAWLQPTMLAAWGTRHHDREPVSTYRRRLRALPAALWRRWPNGIEATVALDADFDDGARLPLQLSECVRLVRRFVRETHRAPPP